MTLYPSLPKHTTSLQEDGSGESLDPSPKHTMVGIPFQPKHTMVDSFPTKTHHGGDYLTAPPLEAEPPTS